jgi:DUF1680 family protein
MIKNNQKLWPIGLKNIKVTGGFWKERLDLTRQVTIPDVLDKLEKDGAINNFKRVRDGKTGYHAGHPWFSGLVYECIRGISDFLAVQYDKALDERLDGYIEAIARAQGVSKDGWLNPYTTLICPENRFGRKGGNLLWSHDLYNAGCLAEAAVHHYKATGKLSLLNVSVKFANYIVSQIGPEPRENIVPAHSLAEEAFLKLSVLFSEDPLLKTKLDVPVDEAAYLELVRFWLDMRGRHDKRKSYPRYMGEYAQDHLPLAEQTEAVGHAVRAGLLYTGIAEYVNITGDETYAAAARRIWENITRRKMHISGNIGAVHNEEKFGYEYQLPSDAYLETCAAVSMVFFARSMFLGNGDWEYIELLEQAIYNGVLPGLSLQGDAYFYENPLTSKGNHQRWGWHPCPCCPPMYLKNLGEFPTYLYSIDDEGVFINLYASSDARIELPEGILELEEKTDFPWEGKISFAIKSVPKGKFKIRLRIPSYAQGFSLSLNGIEIHEECNKGYAIIEREWKPGDEISLNINLKPYLKAAHPYVKAVEGQVAIQYGPLLYCVEEADNNMEALIIPENYRFEIAKSKDFAGMKDILFEDTQYRKVRAIPYFAWANRLIGKMDVWLPIENYKKKNALEWGEELYKPY